MTFEGHEEDHTLESRAPADKAGHEPVLGPRPRRALVLLASGPALHLLGAGCAHTPELTERVYGEWIGPRVGWLLARLTGWFEFSLAELSLALAVLLLVCRVVGTLRPATTSRRRRAARSALRTFRDASLAWAVFQLVFGLHYARPILADRLGEAPPIDTEQLRALAEESVARVNTLYLELHGTEDLGRPTPWPDEGRAIDEALEESWPRAVQLLDLNRSCAWRRGPVKPLRISPLLHRLGLSGFYFPWTGEANVNRTVPAMGRALTYAHEKAHQRGIAREDEAGFTGWLAAETSRHPLVRYAAAVYVHRRLLFELAREDGPAVGDLVRRRLPGVQRDVDDLVDYWRRGRGRATEVAHRVNDVYLRTQRVEDGVESYGRAIDLVLLFAARRGGTLSGIGEPQGGDRP